MFSFLYSQEKKMRQNAANWLEVSERVYKFRRDQLTDAQNQKLLGAATAVKQGLKEKADASKLKLAVESLEGVLRDTGGRIYPQSSLVENVEFFLVAAIVILGLRAYFIQPFEIPTNSMWPSYYGMTAEVFKPGDEPGIVRKAARLLTLGASHYSVVAPAEGEILIPVSRNGALVTSERLGRSLWVFPTKLREYTFMVGGQLAKVEVPADFDREHEFLKEAFFDRNSESFYSALRDAAQKAGPLETSTLDVRIGARQAGVKVAWVPIGKKVRKGEILLSFDILTGDLLFVDRMTYNFAQPEIGSGFVFATDNIEKLKADKSAKYLIKRLVGVPGDVLEIKSPGLYRDGKPIEGAAAFGRNARREDNYSGYTNTVDGALPVGGTATVPAHSFFALGDNSPRSYDSRYWGFVPEKDVVGRPLFIYFPLTSRWGMAR